MEYIERQVLGHNKEPFILLYFPHGLGEKPTGFEKG